MKQENIVGKRLAYLREKMNCSQVELAKKLNVSPSTIAMWELGEREIKASTLIKLAAFFSVSTDFLTGLLDAPDSKNKNSEINGSNFAFFGGRKEELSDEEAKHLEESLEMFRLLKAKRMAERNKDN